MNERGKRVSWVELYLDLVFVLAVGRLAHLIVAEPEMHSVWVALGLFFVLWWTWIGFAVLYNRHGDDDRTEHLLFLLGSVPIGVAAVAIEPAAQGDPAVFAGALAVARLILAVAHGDGGPDLLRGRIARAYLVSVALFAASILVAEPWVYVLWFVAVSQESSVLLRSDHAAGRGHRARRPVPEHPREALDPHHFAERFGLFLIILLGEVLVEAGQAPAESTATWIAIGAAMVLAAALWWLYFDSSAEINLRVLELSGGSPTMARTIFAVGHMIPSFALIGIAAGVGLLLEQEDARFGYVLVSTGIGLYMLGTRAFLRARRGPFALRLLVVIATFNLGRLHEVLSPDEYVVFVAAWVVVCAGLATQLDADGHVGPAEEVGAGEAAVAGADAPDRVGG
ncbi:low temperature requirement protein LtrA [Solirubrobacter pauli]|uniref:Low temperature requirement protein LtrA n=1 Tax=Solirubrobacter pauli TaxID=166793 RepID=A0A660KWW5_9ACTN|nr:low temperature requirement protein LtrA [Solirubrobacter pauli]